MVRCSVFIATSLDGYIARPDGGLDWLEGVGSEMAHDYGYNAFFASVDTLVMGRNTFEVVRGFGGEWPYGDRRLVVLSRGDLEIPDALAATVSVSAETPEALTARLAAEGATHLYIDGGVTIQRFLSAGLIDEMTISVMPVLIGEGIPLFGPTGRDISLELLDSRGYPSGVVQSHYRVRRAD